MTQALTVSTSQYGRLYGPATKAYLQTIGGFVNANRDALVNEFYKISVKGQKVSKSIENGQVIYKADDFDDAEWLDFIANDLGGDAAFAPISVTFYEEAFSIVMEALGEEFEPFDTTIAAVDFARMHGLELSKSLSISLKHELHPAFLEGLAANESPALIKERIRASLEGWEEWQLNRLARTESMFAVNSGALDAIKASTVATHKEWMANAGACVVCSGLDGEVVPKDEIFSGGAAAPPQHPNCRCTIGARIGPGPATVASTT